MPETGGERKGREIKDAKDLLDHLALLWGLFLWCFVQSCSKVSRAITASLGGHFIVY